MKVGKAHQLADAYLTTFGKTESGLLAVRYHRGEFWQWRDRRYAEKSDEQLAAEMTRVIKGEFDRLKQQTGETVPDVTRSIVSNAIQALASITLVDEYMDQPAWLGKGQGKQFVAVSNGLLDLEKLITSEAASEVFTPHSAEWFSTVCLPYAYNPGAECPLWLKFLEEVMEGDAQRISLIQEWFGYCLTSDTSLQKFLLLVGEGANGKSVVCDVLTSVLGDENVSTVPLELFGSQFALYGTLGRLANIATEVGEIQRKAEGYLKAFTSGDRMAFEKKFRDPIYARPTARLVLSTNNPPRFADRSEGVWRRMIVLPFEKTIPNEKQDHRLTQKLRAELPGVFLWAVDGLRRLREQGRFTEPAVSAQALDDYRIECNPAKQFLLERCLATPNGRVSSAILYDAYRTWCGDHGYESLPDTAFGKEVKKAFSVERKRETGKNGVRPRVYLGISMDADQSGPVPEVPSTSNIFPFKKREMKEE